MQGRLVMLDVGSCRIRGQKCQGWGDIWLSTGGKPVDAADDALVDFAAAFEIRLFGVGIGDGIDGHPRPIRRHVGHRHKVGKCKPVR